MRAAKSTGKFYARPWSHWLRIRACPCWAFYRATARRGWNPAIWAWWRRANLCPAWTGVRWPPGWKRIATWTSYCVAWARPWATGPKPPSKQRHRPFPPLGAQRPQQPAFFRPASAPGKTRALPHDKSGLCWAWHEMRPSASAMRICPALLQELGADLAFFSPLSDAAPPPGCCGLYFPGGYPELHAAQLAANTAMRAALRDMAAPRPAPSTANAGATSPDARTASGGTRPRHERPAARWIAAWATGWRRWVTVRPGPLPGWPANVDIPPHHTGAAAMSFTMAA